MWKAGKVGALGSTAPVRPQYGTGGPMGTPDGKRPDRPIQQFDWLTGSDSASGTQGLGKIDYCYHHHQQHHQHHHLHHHPLATHCNAQSTDDRSVALRSRMLPLR